jgi:hypothetical protein
MHEKKEIDTSEDQMYIWKNSLNINFDYKRYMVLVEKTEGNTTLKRLRKFTFRICDIGLG